MSPVADIPLLADPNKGLTWENLAERLLRRYPLPENVGPVGRQKVEDRARREAFGVIAAFKEFPQSRLLGEGTVLLRSSSFRDPYKRRNEPSGHWWFPETLLLGLLNQSEAEAQFNPSCLNTVRSQLQSLLAISDNYSDIEQLWYIKVPPGGQLTVLEGPARKQLVDGGLAGSNENMGELPGGGWQYYLESLPAIKPMKYSRQLLPGLWLRNSRDRY